MTTQTPTETTTTYNRIVVPIDGSDASEAALSYASRLPAKELVLLHVSVDHEVIVPDWILNRDEERAETSLHESMEKLAERLRTPERNVIVDTRIGDVAEEIMDAGRKADLIVMMTHGRGAAGRMVFGSIADRVIRHGETPTLIVRVGELTRNPKIPQRIVVALDGSERAEKAIAGGAKLARTTGLPIVENAAFSATHLCCGRTEQHGQSKILTDFGVLSSSNRMKVKRASSLNGLINSEISLKMFIGWL